MPNEARTFPAVAIACMAAGVLGMSLGGCASRAPVSPPPVAASNLVSGIDLAKHFRTGDWSAGGDQVAVGPDNWARLCLSGQAIPGYYSVRMEFTRYEGREGFGLLLPPPRANGSGFLFQLSAEGNRWAALNEVKGVRHIHVPHELKNNGLRHVLEVKVRSGGVKAWLDGDQILEHSTDYSDIQFRDWGFGDCSFGLISWYNKIVFHRVEVLRD